MPTSSTNGAQAHREWAERARSRLSEEGEGAPAVAEAVYNAFVTALRDGRYVEMSARLEALERRRTLALGSLRKLSPLSGALERAVAEMEREADAVGPEWPASMPPNGTERLLILGEQALRPEIEIDLSSDRSHLVLAGWIPKLRYPSPAEPGPSALVERVRERSQAVRAEYEDSLRVLRRATFVAFYLRHALEKAEMDIWPPLWGETEWSGVLAPEVKPAPMTPAEVSFPEQKNVIHAPFKEWLVATYHYYRAVEELEERESESRTAQDHVVAHGPIIKAARPSWDSTCDPRVVRKYVEG